jgi:hypothetical protein
MSLNTTLKKENNNLEETINCNFKLKKENEELKFEIDKLQKKIKLLESKLNNNKLPSTSNEESINKNESEKTNFELNENKRSLTLEEYLRYGRQLILPGFGLSGNFSNFVHEI